MSFNYYARKVRNLRLDSRTRRSALASCILRLCWLTQQPYQATRARFTAQFELDEPHPPGAEPLLDALAVIEKERNAVLERLRAFERRRIREKMRGRRQLSTAERTALREALTGRAAGNDR